MTCNYLKKKKVCFVYLGIKYALYIWRIPKWHKFNGEIYLRSRARKVLNQEQRAQKRWIKINHCIKE